MAEAVIIIITGRRQRGAPKSAYGAIRIYSLPEMWFTVGQNIKWKAFSMENFTQDQLMAFFQVLVGMIASISIAAIAWYVLQVIANWRIFKKAGEAGWKSIIPIYNNYILFKIAWKPLYFWLEIVIAVVVGVLNVLAPQMENAALVISVVILIALVVFCIFNIIFFNKLSKAFGHGAGFTLGLIFLNPIFILILGFGSSRYLGADR